MMPHISAFLDFRFKKFMVFEHMFVEHMFVVPDIMTATLSYYCFLQKVFYYTP